MKTPAAIISCLLLALLAHADLKEVGYQLGPRLFRDGDSIKIETVRASSPEFRTGKTVAVKGSYTLLSHEEGRISIHVTQTDGDGQSTVAPEQQFVVKRGNGDFEVSIEIQHEGSLHVSFYPGEGGRGFGGVYFGKDSQMREIKDWTLDWYLDESPCGKFARGNFSYGATVAQRLIHQYAEGDLMENKASAR